MTALILIPLITALLILMVPKNNRWIKETLVLAGTLLVLLIAFSLFGENIYYTLPWAGFGIDFSLRLFHFSSFIISAAAAFSFLIALYSIAFVRGKDYAKSYYFYLLLTLTLVNGAVLADNLIVMLFFWESLLLPLFGMIAIGNKNAFKTAIKAFIIIGIADLCMMVGIALTGILAGTLTISQIHLALDPAAAIAFTLLMIGAISKAGSMPFHSWIPDAATDAPLPFMAFMPAALEKLLGIYFLARISFDLFVLTPASWVSYMLMIIGVTTIILAVMMALIQKDYKRLLSYHAISQVGYMILGIGTAVPAGMVGGLFHMLNNAMYKSCLFLTGGAVEKQTGTTDLQKLGGIGLKMPITLACFLVAAVSISGVPPFNGFFSKELVYDGALERGKIFYLLAVLGSFFTAASFLKLGHAAYFGKSDRSNDQVKEASWTMLVPMITIAALCVIFGIFNSLPLNNLIQPILGHKLEGMSFAGWPTNNLLVITTLLVLLAAILNHWFGAVQKGSGLKAADHIHYAPILSPLYDRAEKRYFDPYDLSLKLFGAVARTAWWLDRFIDWIQEKLIVGIAFLFSNGLRRAHNGNYINYLVWSLVGTAVIIFMLGAK